MRFLGSASKSDYPVEIDVESLNAYQPLVNVNLKELK